ncbi:hypothetical protein SEA_ABT2GRADUATEX2_50 [Streptomyces phage Abt2graduatex2]|nr:hypothetical protein SEA_ABT2GRADUATEX2_50 [Streptomyces phage Abt2graduatex2]
MSRVITWITKATGVLTNRIGIRITHDLTLSDLINGLGSRYGRNVHDVSETEFHQLSRKDMMDVIKDEYAYYGTSAVWTWSDHTDSDVIKAVELWAENLILRHFPEMAEHRG